MAARDSRVSLLACDLDGTLLDDAGTPVRDVGAALRSLQQRGVHLTICTGRPLHAARRLAGLLPVSPDAYICYHGSLVVDVASGLWLKHLTLRPELVDLVLAECRTTGLVVTLYVGDERRELGEELDAPDGVTRLILRGDAQTADSAAASLRSKCGRRLRVEVTMPGIVDVLHGAADKGNALLFLARRLGLHRGSIAACGDSESDITMLRAAALAIAVGDASPDVCTVADRVVPQAGLAVVLRDLLP
jgi:HAD superfamily hydrolase (TIGR01484 family)